jgi:hypothetical protein
MKPLMNADEREDFQLTQTGLESRASFGFRISYLFRISDFEFRYFPLRAWGLGIPWSANLLTD